MGDGVGVQSCGIDDVADAVVSCLDERESFGRAYDLCGPMVYSLSELVAYAGSVNGHYPFIFGLSKGNAYAQAWIMELLPGRLLTRDNFRSMQVDSVSDAPMPFGISATALAVAAPLYLRGQFARSRYSLFRNRAGR